MNAGRPENVGFRRLCGLKISGKTVTVVYVPHVAAVLLKSFHKVYRFLTED